MGFWLVILLLTSIQINSGCKKEESKPHIIDLYSSRNYILLDGIHTVGSKISVIKYDKDILNIEILGSWSGEDVTCKIYKDLILVKQYSQKGYLKVKYEIQP